MLQVFEISDPANPVPIGSYVTEPAPSGSTNTGSWGVFPLLGPDIILASDWHNRLFVLDDTPVATRSQAFDIYPDEPGLVTAFAPPARGSSDTSATIGGAPEARNASTVSPNSGFTLDAAHVWSGVGPVLEQGAPAVALIALAAILALLIFDAHRRRPRLKFV